MSIVLDLLVVALALYVIIVNTKQGFIRAFIGMASNVVSLLLAYAFSTKLSLYFQEKFMLSAVTNGIHSLLTSLATTDSGSPFKLSALAENDMFKSLCTQYGADMDQVKTILDGGGEATEESITELANVIGSPVSHLLSYILAFIAIFVVSMIVIRLIGRILNLVTKSPEIKATNRVMGFILGVVSAIISCWALSLGLEYAMTALGALSSDWFGAQVIEDTYLVKIFTLFNPVTDIINSLISSAS